MRRASLVLLVSCLAGSWFARPALAQQGVAPPIDPATVLATLKDLRARQAGVVNRERANVLAAINAAIADPAHAYEQAVAAVEMQGAGGNESGRLADWRRREGDLLRNRDFINGLRLQLIYLSLTWRHQMGAKPAELVTPLLDYTGQVANAAESLAPFLGRNKNSAESPDGLNKSIGQTVFATFFQVGSFITSLTGWEEHPFDVAGIYDKAILPELRLDKDPRLLTCWDARMQLGSAQATNSQNALAINEFNNIELPKLFWAKAEDEIVLGRQNQAIADMLTILKAHPDHPDFLKWTTKLEALVSPPVVAKAPLAAAPVPAAAAPPEPPAPPPAASP